MRVILENEELNEKVEDNEWVQSYIEGRDLIDLLNDFATTELQPENLYQLLKNYHLENIQYLVVMKRYLMKCILQLVLLDTTHTDVTVQVYVQFNLLNVFNQVTLFQFT